MTSEDAAGTDLIISRLFHAPRPLVWNVLTDARHIAAWWGPEGLTTRVERHEFRVGGHWRYVMVAQDGREYPAEGMFIDIEPPERFVTTDEFGPDYTPPDGGDLPTGTVMTVTFESLGDATRLTLHLSHRTAALRRRHEEMGVLPGWNSALDKLATYLSTLETEARP